MQENWIVLANGPTANHPGDLFEIGIQRRIRNFGIMCVSNTYRLIRPDAIYSHDDWWWRKHYEAVRKTGAELFCPAATFRRRDDVTPVRVKSRDRICPKGSYVMHGGNSGHQAIDLLRIRGAKRVAMLGFCFQGQRWSGQHKENEKEPAFDDWILNMGRMARSLPAGFEVTNCSRNTAIPPNYFRQRTIYEWLGSLPPAE